jgi:hypothetical protein
MTGETAAAAIAKFRADLPDVTCRDFGAAQGAISVRARSTIIDKNEAEHIGPPPGIGFFLKTRRDFGRLLPIEIRFDWPLFPQSPFSDRICRSISGEAGALGNRDAAAAQRQ